MNLRALLRGLRRSKATSSERLRERQEAIPAKPDVIEENDSPSVSLMLADGEQVTLGDTPRVGYIAKNLLDTHDPRSD